MYYGITLVDISKVNELYLLSWIKDHNIIAINKNQKKEGIKKKYIYNNITCPASDMSNGRD